MADTKISALTELTTPAPTDEFVVVDKSDTSMAASGTDKRITVLTLRSGVFNVKDYGATGDGTTDDTLAIQAALTAAGARGLVWFPKGEYKVSDQGSGFCLDISTLSGITLAGAAATGLDPSGSSISSIIFTTSTSTKIIKAEAASINHRGPKLLDLRIESRSASATGLSIIDFNHYVLERVVFRGVGQAGAATSTGLRIQGVEDASYGRIEGCYFHRHLYGAVTVGSVGATFAGSCYFESNVTNHVLIDLQNTASAVVVMGAKFQCNAVSGAIGIRQGSAGATLGGDVQFIGNNFEGCTVAIDLLSRGTLGYTGTVVMGNSFFGSGGGTEIPIQVGTNRRGDQIIGNRFANNAVGMRVVDSGTETLIVGGRTDQTSIAGEFINIGGVGMFSGTNSPESVLTAAIGSMFLRRNGGAGTTLYVKESGTGNTGWVGK